jgi:predicted transcriptional regulator YheO
MRAIEVIALVQELIPYLNMIDFLSEVLGKNTEIVLHDLTNSQNSIVAIRNGHISGRGSGNSVTDIAVKMNEDDLKCKDKKYMCNYTSQTQSGKRLRSSTFYIRNNRNKLVGMMCINTDCSELTRARDILNSLISVQENEQLTANSEERFSDVEEKIQNEIQSLVLEKNISPERLSQQEKIGIVKEIYQKGIYQMKGSVLYTAKLLCVSEPTVYRYLNQIRKEAGSEFYGSNPEGR